MAAVDRRVKWSDEYYVRAYQLARQGDSDGRIAKKIGVMCKTFLKWKRQHPALRKALAEGRENRNRNFQAGFRDLVYNRLSPELQEVWDDINACEKEPGGVARIEAILDDQGVRVRQHFFLYALVESNFNASEACRRVNISRNTLEHWKLNDPGFSEIVDQMHLAKGDLFEEGLVRAVKDGDTKAILFANRTYNRHRGYNEKIEVEHSGQLNHLHALVDLDSLDLPLEVRAAILEAVRKQKKLTVEAEVVPQNGNGHFLPKWDDGDE